MTQLTKSEGALPNEGVDVMIIAEGALGLMNELTDIMRQETIILETQKYVGHAELLKRKQRLTLDYRAMMKNLSAQPDLLKKLPDTTRMQIRQSAQKLMDVSDRNARILRVAVIGVQKLLQSVIRIVKQEALPQNSYAKPNTKSSSTGLYSPTCKPVAINRTA